MSLDGFSLTLTHRRGPVGKRPRLVLVLTLEGVLGFPQIDCGGNVAVGIGGIAEFRVTGDQFGLLCQALEKTGVETRVPKVDGKMDTSDTAARLIMHVAFFRVSRTLDVDLLSSGYEGPDAPALQKFLGLVLDAAGVNDPSIRFDLADA